MNHYESDLSLQHTTLNNSLNLFYHGSLWVGSGREQLELIFDTGSDWLVLETDFCESCIAPVFQSGLSTTYSILEPKIYSREYGSASI